MAILKTLKFIENNNWLYSTIFSDSKSVLTALSSKFNPKKSSQIILTVKDLLRKLSNKTYSIKLIWIPSHIGITGNERADTLAKEAIKLGTYSHFDIPISDIQKLWKFQLYLEFND